MESITTIYIGLAAFALYVLYRRSTRPSLDDIRGPGPESFLIGNLREIFKCQSGESDFKWQEQYGNVVRLKASLGGDLLYVSDPKALQYIFQTSGYNYPKLTERRAMSRLHSGHGLVWADGQEHKRQRKVMLPAFGGPEIRALFPLFTRHAESISLKWKDILVTAPEQTTVFNVCSWLSYATMDAIGEAAFDYSFNAMEDPNSAMIRAYNNLMQLAFGFPSDAKITAMDTARFIPLSVIEWLQDHLPGKGLEKARESEKLTVNIAKQLVDSKVEACGEGKGMRDVFSLLVKANSSEDEKTRFSEDELISALRTILFAGHETTSNTISWALLELARNPSAQTKLRQEIHEMEHTVRAHGAAGFSSADMDQMPYMQAVIKESLRMHPVLPQNFRCALKDDVIPLSKPIITRSGQVLNAVPVSKGTRIVLSIAGYNRNREIWGEDVHVFRPERWLDGSVKKGTTVGVYNNLLTFAGGIRACIGWRFAVHEFQAFLVELVSNFEFAVTDDIKRLRREMCGVMLPMLEGEQGTQMPLQVSLAARDS